jgi:hypothetical protein
MFYSPFFQATRHWHKKENGEHMMMDSIKVHHVKQKKAPLLPVDD